MEPIVIAKGTHPLLTVAVFGAIIAGVVVSGSYFSKQRSAARDLEVDLRAPISAIFGQR